MSAVVIAIKVLAAVVEYNDKEEFRRRLVELEDSVDELIKKIEELKAFCRGEADRAILEAAAVAIYKTGARAFRERRWNEAIAIAERAIDSLLANADLMVAGYPIVIAGVALELAAIRESDHPDSLCFQRARERGQDFARIRELFVEHVEQSCRVNRNGLAITVSFGNDVYRENIDLNNVRDDESEEKYIESQVKSAPRRAAVRHFASEPWQKLLDAAHLLKKCS